MAEEHERRRGASGFGEGIRSGIGVLNAFKEAIEETIQEAVERGDLSPDRAKQAMRDAAKRFQDSVGEAREKLDLVPRREFDELKDEVAELRRRVAALDGRIIDPLQDAPGDIPIEAE
jgi:polyhydroxyalkanoate synthesis regulator phasin